MRNPLDDECSSFDLLIAVVLSKNTKIKRFNKTDVTEANKRSAVYLARFKWDKSERERIEREAEEARKAEEEANAE